MTRKAVVVSSFDGDGIKAASLWRPWPYAIMKLGKRLENRFRNDRAMPALCRHRGYLFLHAAQRFDHSAADWIAERGLCTDEEHAVLSDPGAHPAGGIVGMVDAIGQLRPDGTFEEDDGKRGGYSVMPVGRDYFINLDLRWWMKGHALVLHKDVVETAFVPCPAKQGTWTVPEAQCNVALKPFHDRVHARMGELVDQAKAGTLLCPGCGVLRPKLTKQRCYALYCDTCRGDDA